MNIGLVKLDKYSSTLRPDSKLVVDKESALEIGEPRDSPLNVEEALDI